MKKILKSYLRRLSDISGKSPSLLLLRLPKTHLIDLHDFDYEVNEPSFHLIEQLLAKNNKIRLCEDINTREQKANERSVRLRKIVRTERLIFEERGAKDLYVGWPFVKGKFSDGTSVRCPLLFFPVALQREKNTWFLALRKEVPLTLNKTFLLAYSYYNGVPLNEDLVEMVFDDYEKDSLRFRTQLYNLLKESEIEIHFNQENFFDQLAPFKEMIKPMIEAEEKDGMLKLYPHAVLGIFPQAGSYMVPDYVKLIEENAHSDFEDFFIEKNRENEQKHNPHISEEHTYTPFALDAYQEHALKEVKRGKSIVVQGPPGTGKSQLIGNLICDFMARGKSVLLVCQKRVALDVVHERLREKELQDFVALVHDFKNDRKAIYEQINTQIGALKRYEKENNGLDTIPLERGFSQASRAIDRITEELERFREALFEENECGKSAKELYLNSSPYAPNFPMDEEYRFFHYHEEAQHVRRLKEYLHYFEKLERNPHFWASGPSFDEYETSDLIHILSSLDEVLAFQSELQSTSKEIFASALDFATVHVLNEKKAEWIEVKTSLKEKAVFEAFKKPCTKARSDACVDLAHAEESMRACFAGSGVEQTLSKEGLEQARELIHTSRRARGNPFRQIRWKLFSKEKAQLVKVLDANALRNNQRDIELLSERIKNRLEFERALHELEKTIALDSFPTTFSLHDIIDWFRIQNTAFRVEALTTDLPFLKEGLPVNEHTTHRAYLERINELDALVGRASSKLKKWEKYLSLPQIQELTSKKGSSQKEEIQGLIQLLKKDFDALCEFHQLKKRLSSEEKKVLDKMVAMAANPKQAIDLFLNSLAIAWLNHIESKHPCLRNATSGKLETFSRELTDQIENKRGASKEILLLKAKEKTYENVEYNRLGNRTTYRDLQHQVSKKRKIWPIRKLIDAYADALFALLPCWMCSPQSASAIFPLKEMFDLVIFDEASQCFVERGIPSMHRGKQVVVSGDRMQLQPNDLYRVRWDDQEEDTAELEVDSLLAFSSRYLPQIHLCGHYRSRSPELIDFSNRHFYEGRLHSLPHYDSIQPKEPAIDFVKCQGVWEDGLNREEAKKIVECAFEYLVDHPDKEVGIISFNYRQQGYILDLLEEESIERNIPLPSSLFVKNIENVQGDERDVILFSVTYAANPKGKIKLFFGSLNTEGGENRLNVAVSRAREKMIVFSSLMPYELRTDQTKNRGPKLLSKFLEYAQSVSLNKWTHAFPPHPDRQDHWFLRNRIGELYSEEEEVQIARSHTLADLSIRKENVYSGLILTDDEKYYEALSSKQIYAFWHFHLKKKNWPYVQLHSREYWQDKEALKKKIGTGLHFPVENETK